VTGGDSDFCACYLTGNARTCAHQHSYSVDSSSVCLHIYKTRTPTTDSGNHLILHLLAVAYTLVHRSSRKGKLSPLLWVCVYLCLYWVWVWVCVCVWVWVQCTYTRLFSLADPNWSRQTPPSCCLPSSPSSPSLLSSLTTVIQMMPSFLLLLHSPLLV
jgi:hypothetical protein